MNDGRGPCQCHRCREYDIPELAAKANYSERLLLFHGRAVREAGVEFPDKFFGIYAYGGLRDIPRKLKSVSNHLFMEHVPNHMVVYGSREAIMDEINPILEFSRFGLSMGYYSAATSRLNALPVSLARILEEFIPLLCRNRVAGMYFYPTAEGDWDAGGLTFYLYARLGWEHDLDVGKLREEYVRRSHGPAGEGAREYHAVLEQALKEWANDPNHYSGRDREAITDGPQNSPFPSSPWAFRRPCPGGPWLVNSSRMRPPAGVREKECTCVAPTFELLYTPRFFAALICCWTR